MAVTKDDTTQGAVAPVPEPISPGGVGPVVPPGVAKHEAIPTPQVSQYQLSETNLGIPPPSVPHVPQPIPPQILRSEAANAHEIMWASRGLSIRAGYLPQPIVQQMPWTALAIASSSLSNDQIDRIGQNIEATWAYIRAQAGSDEWLVAKARAMYISDPVKRAEALDFLDRQRHGTMGMDSPFGRQTLAEAIEMLSRDFEFELPNGQKVTGPIAAYTNGHPFHADWLSPPMNIVDAVLNTVFAPMDAAARGVASAAGAVLGLLPQGVSAGIGAIGVNEDVSDRVAEWISDLPTEAYEATNVAFARAVDVLGGAATVGLSNIWGAFPGSPIDQIPLRDWKRYIWPEEMGMGFGRAMAQAGGLHAGDRGYDEIVSTTNFIGQLILGAKVAKTFAATKAAFREGLPEGYAQALDQGIIPGSQSPLTGALADQPFTNAMQFRLALEQQYGFLGRTAYEMLGKPPSEWVRSGLGRRRFERLNELVHQPGGIARAIEEYRPGSYTIDMLESMAKTTELEQARQVYVRATQGLPDPMYQAEQLARVSALDRQIAMLDEGMGRLTEAEQAAQRAPFLTTPEGEPLRVYHGQRGKPFELLEPAEVSGGDNLYGPAAYFTDNPEVAVSYTRGPVGIRPGEPLPDSVANVTPGFIRPKRLVKAEDVVELDVRVAFEELIDARAGEPMTTQLPDYATFEQAYRFTASTLGELGLDPQFILNDMNTALRRIGIDVIEYEGGKRIGGYGEHRAFAVLDPAAMTPGTVPFENLQTPSLRLRRDLESRRLVISNSLDRPFSAPPIRYPSRPVIMEMLSASADNAYGRFMSTALGRGRSWFQEGTNAPLLRPGTAPWAKERTAAVLRKRANVAGIDRGTVRGLLTDLAALPDGDLLAWEAWVEDFHRAFATSSKIDPALLSRFTTWGHVDPLERAGSWIAERSPDPDVPGRYRTIRRPVLEVRRFNPRTGEDMTIPLRNMTAMGLGDEVHLAPYEVLVDASSLYRKLIRKGKGASKLNPGHWAATLWDGGAFLMDSATALFKSMALTGYGLRTIPLTTRILGEEILARTPGYMYQWFDSRDLSMFEVAGHNGRIITPLNQKVARTLKGGHFRSPTATPGTPRGADLGSILMDDHIRGMSSGYRLVTTVDPLSGRMTRVGAEALYDDLMLTVRSPEQRALLRIGPNKWVDKMLAERGAAYEFLSPKVEQVWAQKINKPRGEFGIEDVRAAWRDHAITERRYLEQIIGGNENLADAIRTGQDWRWKPQRSARLGKTGLNFGVRVPKDIKDTYANLILDEARYRNNLQHAIDEGRTTAEIEAAQKVWRKSLDDLRAIEREYDIPVNWGTAAWDSPRSFQQALQQATDLGEYLPPREVRARFDERKTTGRLGEDLSSFRRITGALADAASTFGYWPMAKVTSPLDIRWARGPLYRKAARNTYDRLRAQGWDRDRALALAKYQGAETARRIMYDLGATSRFDKAMRNVFWFLPAYRELLTTWMIKIPSQYYWPVGALYLANRAHLVVDWLSGAGVIHQNADGEWQTDIPFMGAFLNHLTGTDTVKEIVTLSPDSLNFVAAGPKFHGVPLPGFSKQYNVLLTQLALRNPDVWKGVADVMLPYGPDTSAGTPAMNNFYQWLNAMTDGKLGEVPIWDHYWGGRAKANWDLASDDAIRVARTIVGPPPDIQSDRYEKTEAGHMTPAAQRLYERDWEEWKDDMREEQYRVMQATFLVRTIGSTVFPASLQVSNDYKNDANELLDELYGFRPDDYFENPGSPEAIAWRNRRDKVFNEFLADHPDGYFFLVAKTAAGEKAPFDPYRTAAGEDDFWMRIFKDYRITLDGETFLERASGMESYRWFTANVNANIEQMGGDAPSVLRNWFERSTVMETRSDSWNDYLILHDDFAKFLKDQSNIWAQDPKNQIPDLSLQAQRLLEANQALRSIDELFSVDGIRNRDVRAVERLIADVLFGTGPGAEGVNFGPPRTEIEKGVAWWWKNVGRPYLDRVDKLVEQAFAAQGLGDMELAGSYWSKVRDMANATPGRSHDGLAYPSPQEVFWGSKSPEEQRKALLAWATKPVAWLTNFQRGQVGYASVPGANDFFDVADAKWDAFYDFVQDPARPGHYREGYSPNSKAYDELYNQTRAAVEQEARARGPAIYNLYLLNIAAPASRLAAVGGAPAIFDSLAQQAAQIVADIEAEGFSPRGWGEVATELKIGFFKSVENAWRHNSGLKSYLRRVMSVMTLPGGEIERDGAMLYDALFFGNFKPPGQIGSIPQGFTSTFTSLIGFAPPAPNGPVVAPPTGGTGGGGSVGPVGPVTGG